MDPNKNKPGEGETQQTTEEAMLAAMDAGVQAAATEEAAAPVVETPTPNAEVKPEGDAAAPAAGEQKPTDAKPEGDKPEGEAAKSEGAAKPEGEGVDKPKEPDAEIEKEIVERGLKGNAAERFRDLASQVKELAPLRDTLTEAKLKPEDLPRVVKAAQDFEGWVGQVLDTGATPEQYGQTLDYLRLVNSDPEKAFELALGEVQTLAKALGKDIPGLHDPLTDHPDLQEDVQSGEMKRERALQLVRERAQAKLLQEGQRAQAERDKQAGEQRSAAEFAEKGRQDLNALGAELAKADPDYAAKVELLKPMLGWIRQNLPPQQWAQATRDAYAKIPAVPKAPAPSGNAGKPPIGHVSGRAGGGAHMVPATFDDPMAALDAGIEAATG